MQKQQPEEELFLKACMVGDFDKVKQNLEDSTVDPFCCNQYGQNGIHLSGLYGHLELMKFLLSKCPDLINRPHMLGGTPLHYAALGGHLDCVKFLLESGAEVDAEDEYQRTPFDLAAEKGSLEVLEFLLSYSERPDQTAFLNRITEEGNSPLMMALNHSRIDAAKYLIDKGADITLTNDLGLNALHMACGSEEGVMGAKWILEEKLLSPKTRTKEGQTLMHFAAREAHVDLVLELLHDHKISTTVQDKNGAQPIHFAAKSNKTNIVDVLVDNGALVNARDMKGAQPIHYACMMGGPVGLKALEAKGADVKAKGENGSTCLHYAALGGNSAILQYLLDSALRPDVEDKNGIRPLHTALQHRHVACVNMLLDAGADPLATLKSGDTTLTLACQGQEMTQIALRLLEAGVDAKRIVRMQPPRKGEHDAMRLAAYHGMADVIKALSKVYGVDINRADPSGVTPLHIAAGCNQFPAVDALLTLGADKNAVSKDGLTPAEFAEKSQSAALARFIREYDPSKGSDETE
eukprot:GCRY01003643.1.p1 GENE.GCRY01003643.1~~GCRY01003643.1.p1  ORF type:complete len:521 (+),score=95.76 GCRY01003643.1:130-1692(+)